MSVTDRQWYITHNSLSVQIYFDSNTHKIKNTNESFIVYNDSAILNRLSEFPATLVQTETRIFYVRLNVK